ncbi:helix-turn-helix domain-containing protein [Streptomyces sp. NPDC048415]|uniref:helix-turn-helix domain-containing protein n=1 Tax=Streptomyces sp. NPDC048415 TaxID=3154822 RepID=UPI003414E66C
MIGVRWRNGYVGIPPFNAWPAARIVLLAAGGCPARRIAEIVRVDVSTVVRWRDRCAREGLAGLDDRPRSGRPSVHGPEVRLRIVATVTSTPPTPTTPGRTG